MLTIETVENIKKGSWITFYNGIYAMILGILNIALFRYILKMDFRAIDVVQQVFSKYNPALNFMFVKLVILKGIFIFTVGIAIVYLSNYIIKKKDKAAWIILFLIGIIFWPALLAIEVLNKNLYTGIAVFIGWMTFIIGMIIPMKYYLKKDYGEY